MLERKTGRIGGGSEEGFSVLLSQCSEIMYSPYIANYVSCLWGKSMDKISFNYLNNPVMTDIRSPISYSQGAH